MVNKLFMVGPAAADVSKANAFRFYIDAHQEYAEEL